MKEKIIVITGASQGLGKTVATKLIADGATVALIAHDKDKLDQVATELGEKARPYQCDVSDATQVRQTAKRIIDDFSKIDILINNAGVWTDEEVEKTDPDRRKKAFEVNTLGTIEFTKAFEPTFRKQNNGHVLNVISTSGDSSTSSGDNRLWQTYGATKWALAGFTRAFKDSLDSTNIKSHRILSWWLRE